MSYRPERLSRLHWPPKPLPRPCRKGQRPVATPPPQPSDKSDGGLSDEARQEIAQLKARDLEVRTHEQAHKSVGGPYAGSISYEYVTGPDRRQYAVGGEVPIDASPIEGDPEAPIRKMEIVYAAALAPAEPSPQDRSVARLAQSQMNSAQAELALERQEQLAALLEEGDSGSARQFHGNLWPITRAKPLCCVR